MRHRLGFIKKKNTVYVCACVHCFVVYRNTNRFVGANALGFMFSRWDNFDWKNVSPKQLETARTF